MPVEYLLVPIAFLTSTLTGVIGMGGGVLLLACMPGLLPVAAIFPLHAATQLASNATRALFGWREIQWSIVAPVALGAALGAVLGGSVYGSLNLHWLPAIVGVLILLITWVPLPSLPGAGRWSLVLLGLYQTGLGMLAGATGPLGAAVLARRNPRRDWVVVNTGVYMVISHVFRLFAFTAIGFSFAGWWPLLLALITAVSVGSWVGTRLRHSVPQMDFRRWFRLLVSLLALRMIALPLLGD
ncbi:sulfite exporter TauE/SafE family protein [Mangrovimicrobium sediminis]|nr:sulfite exporter TauE/SafE family protein [Haliea sp. SAOS-164]